MMEWLYQLILSCDCQKCSSSDNPKQEVFDGNSQEELEKSAEDAGWRLYRYPQECRHKSHFRSAKHLK